MELRCLLGALCAAITLCATAAIPPTEQVVAVEFYHAAFDHYFITADPREIDDLDTGVHTGWARTGYRFAVIKSGSTYQGTSPVCRFYSPSLDTHFYSAKPQECEDVKVKWPQTWTSESAEVFRAFLVDPFTGACPADTTPTYRLYNNRGDANHRYSDQLSVFVFMKGKEYVAEGDGNPAIPVAFCTPAGGDAVPAASASAPNCTVTASSPAPALGSMLTLTANCTNNPTTFLWTGCTSMQGTCSTTRSTAGAASYTLYAANAQGPADPVTVNVNWGGGGAVPICTLTATTLAPTVNTSLTLSASCSQGPTSYEWVECDYYAPSVCNPLPQCSSTAPSCTVTSSITAYTRYLVAGTNGAGTGARAEVQIEWRSATNNGFTGGFCGQYPRAKRIVVPWGDTARYKTTDYGGLPADTIFVVEFTVPSAPSSYAASGLTSFYEFTGPPALRQLTLSSTACDFRDTDPAGANGPFATSTGTVPLIDWNVGAPPVGLVAGRTYYFNFRTVTCSQLTCEAGTATNWPH